MTAIRVRSLMKAEDLKDYLLYNQYYSERYYIYLRVAVSVIIGVLGAYISSERISTFCILTLICLLVFFLFPYFRIKGSYKNIYLRNKSGAFTQSQDFIFTKMNMGFKSERELAYEYIDYSSLMRVVETKRLLIFVFSKKKNGILVKEFINENERRELIKLLSEKTESRFIKLERI